MSKFTNHCHILTQTPQPHPWCTAPSHCPLQPHAAPVFPSSGQALAHLHVFMSQLLLPLLGKSYFPRLSYSPIPKINHNSLLNLCFFLICETRTVCTTTPAQKPDSICTLVIGKTLSLYHCHFQQVPDSPTLCMFGVLNQYLELQDGRKSQWEGVEKRRGHKQALAIPHPSLSPPLPPQPRF